MNPNKNNSGDYDREEAWDDLYKKHDEEKTGQKDFRSFAEQFEERGMKGFNKAEKEQHQYRDSKLTEAKRTRYPENPQASLDLHGDTVEQAKPKLERFIRESREIGLRFVVVIPGLGRNSVEGKSKLRPMAVQALEEMVKNHLVADFRSAEPRHGGYGALYVYLK